MLALSGCLLLPGHAALASVYVGSFQARADLVLDPGHSPSRLGAKSCSGTYEYVYNNSLTNTVVEYLAAQGINVLVTRGPDGESSLTERAKMSAGKKLFISLHHDSAQPQFIQYVNGNPCSNKAEGFSIFISSKNAFFQESLAISRVLGESLRNSGLHPSRHHGENILGENKKLLDKHCGIYLFDDLIVLKKARSPALLLEAGVIINPVDDAKATTKAYQREIAEAIAKAIKFAGRQTANTHSSPLKKSFK